MKKVLIMLAMCGFFAGMQAQTDSYMKSDRKKDKDKTGMSSTTYTKTPTYTQSSYKESENVPDKVKDAFKDAYGDVKATWKKEGENFRGWIKSSEGNSMETIVVYDKDGNRILTEKELKSSATPGEITSYCSDHNYGRCNVWEVDSKSGMKKYYITQNGKTTWFDSKGQEISGGGEDANMIHNSNMGHGSHMMHKTNYRSK
jgi:hypothetical protein